MNEETIFEGNVTNAKSIVTPKKSKINANVADKTTKEKKKSGVATAAGFAGVASYAAGILTPLQVFPSESGDLSENTENTENTTTLSEHHIGHDLNVATSVDDSMSFSEAFAAARAEVGAGGVFIWHGNTYGTYYAGEWNSMSEEDKEQYWANVYHTTANMNNEISNSVGDEPPVVEPVPLDPPGGWESELDSEELIGETDELIITEEGNLDEEDVVNMSVEDMNEIQETSDADNEILYMDSDDYSSEEVTEDNPDVDILASNSFDSDIPIENNMDMAEYV